jgi:hypothetical protein
MGEARRNVCVAAIPHHWTPDMLSDAFARFGAVASSRILYNGSATNKGFVLFAEPAAAAAAVQRCTDGADEVAPPGEAAAALRLHFAQKQPPPQQAPPAPAPSPNGVPRLSLADALFQAWQRARHPKPCGKELKEAMATVRKTGALFKAQRQPRAGAAVGEAAAAAAGEAGGEAAAEVWCVEVGAGHGMLSLLHLAFRRCDHALLLDVAQPASYATMRRAWAPFLAAGARVEYAVENAIPTLRPRLAALLGQRQQPAQPSAAADAAGTDAADGDIGGSTAASGGPASYAGCDTAPRARRVVCLGVHACDLLTDFILERAMDAGADFAVVTCCHKDRSPGRQLSVAARACGVRPGVFVDAVRMGRVIERGYRCDFTAIDAAITEQNRVLIGRRDGGCGRGGGGGGSCLGFSEAAAEQVTRRWERQGGGGTARCGKRHAVTAEAVVAGGGVPLPEAATAARPDTGSGAAAVPAAWGAAVDRCLEELRAASGGGGDSDGCAARELLLSPQCRAALVRLASDAAAAAAAAAAAPALHDRV